MSEGEQSDDSQKTEDPTPKKLEEARKRGQVALSREVNNWVMLLAGTILIMAFAGTMFTDFRIMLTHYLDQAHNLPSAPGGMKIILGGALTESLKILALSLLLLLVAAFMGPFLQIGPLYAPEVIQPDLSKISIIKGFSRLFSMRALMEFAKGIMKIGLIGLVGTIIMYPYFDKMEHMVGLEIPLLMAEMKALVMKLMMGTLVVLLVIAALDMMYQRIEYYKKMRMTKQEVKDEYKQTEGDPHVKSKLRQLRAEKARQRMMQNVPTADVVITNPTHYSIALKYDPDKMEAPLCVAKGVDDLALRIREVAKEHNITLYENKPLARALYDTVEVDETVPPEHYKAVAEVISFVFKLKGRLKSRT
jgi:flagellar biosynthetic protein FlhB